MDCEPGKLSPQADPNHGQEIQQFINGRIPGLGFLLFLFVILQLSGCTRDPVYISYQPHENLLSLAAEFELTAALDPYRDRPGRDLSGQSISRSSIVRLANYENLHPGRFTPEVLMYKGRALELLGDYESAVRNFQEVIEYETELTPDARRRISKLDRLRVLLREPPGGTLQELIDDLARQAMEVRELSRNFDDPWYRSLAMREWEAIEVRRAELLATNRQLVPDGDNIAGQALAGVLSNHRESARALEHALRLARYHRSLAEEECRLNPPEGPWFSAERFRDHYDRATDLLYRISQADGEPERLVARHELDALLRFGEIVGERMR